MKKLIRKLVVFALCLSMALSVEQVIGAESVQAAVTVTTPAKVQAVLYPVKGYESNAYRSIRVAWTKVPDATGYVVYYRKKEDPTIKKYVLNKNSNVLNFANQVAGKRYIFYVRAFKRYGNKVYYSDKSMVVGINTLIRPSAAPKVAKATQSYVKVNWNAVAGATGYQVSCYTERNKAKTVATLSSKFLYRYVKPGYKNRVMYYRVRAIAQYKTSDGKTRTVCGPWSLPTAYVMR